jgi:hypothetical protein
VATATAAAHGEPDEAAANLPPTAAGEASDGMPESVVSAADEEREQPA